MQLRTLLSLGAATILGGHAAAQVFPTLPLTRSFDLIMGERGHEDLIRLRDLDQNGDYQGAGESLQFFTTSTPLAPTVSGIALSSLTGVACGMDGAVYAVDSTGDQIVQMRDLNGDGDADDVGEAVIWFSSAGNASGVGLGAAQSLAFDSLGRLFVLTANQGTTLAGLDGILLIRDLNLDGDAQDAGEAVYWCIVPNASGGLGHSNPNEFAIGPDGAIYYSDIGAGGPIAKGVYKAQDLNLDGDANDPGEVTLWWVPPFTNAAWFGMAFDAAGYLYLANQGASSRSIYRAFDADASGSIGAGEQQLFYTSAAALTFWDIARRDDGVLLTLDGAANQVLAFSDLNADGDFLDAGEAIPVFDCLAAGFPLADPRAIAFMRAPQLDMLPSTVSLGSPTSWSMRTSEPFDLGIALAALTIVPPISLPPWGHLEIDPSTLILFGLGVSDITCQASFTLTIGSDPALLGIYACQAWCGELSHMYFSNPASLVVTP